MKLPLLFVLSLACIHSGKAGDQPLLPGNGSPSHRGYSVSITIKTGLYDNPDIYVVLEGTEPGNIFTLTTKKDRTAVIYDVAAGEYDLYFNIPGYSHYFLSGIQINQDFHLNCSTCPSLDSPTHVRVIWPELDISWSPPVHEYQPVFFDGFDSGTIAGSWHQEFISDTLHWTAQAGSPSGDPGHAFRGEFNAGLPGGDGITILASPSLDLSQAVKPRLHFWYAQTSDSNAISDRLEVCYRNVANGEWKLLCSYGYDTHSWSGSLLGLPDPTGQYSIGFRGDLSAMGGNGICLDEIYVMTSYYNPETDPVQGYKVYLDGQYIDYYPEAGRYPLPDLPPGFHIAGVQAIYPGMESIIVEAPFYSTPCTYLDQPVNFYGTIEDTCIVLHWGEPPGLSGSPGDRRTVTKRLPDQDSAVQFELTGYHIWYFDRILAYVDDTVHEFTDTPDNVCDSTQLIRHRYTLSAVYDLGESCRLDPPFEADTYWNLPMPGTVSASGTGEDSVRIVWIAAPGGSIAGYNLYRNRQLVAFVTDTFYCEPAANRGTWNYEVSALMQDGGESCLAGPACFSFRANGVKGTVEDVVTRQPLAGASILLTPGNHSAVSGCDGDYALEDIPAGAYEGSVSLPGYFDRHFEVAVDPWGFVTRDILLADSSLSMVPFREPWDSSSFAFQHWSFDTLQGLWNIEALEGMPAPCASFGGDPPMTGYQCSLVSNRMDVTGRTGNLFLSLDMRLGMNNPTGTEMLDIEVWNGKEWILCQRFQNLEAFDWTTHHYDLTPIVKGPVTQVRFTAQGSISSDIEAWLVDNITLETDVMGILSGYVTDSFTQPLEGIMITIGETQTVTDPDGFYTLEVPAGHLTVSVSAAHFNPYCDTVNVYGEVNHDIILTRPAPDPHPTSIYVDSWGGIETRELELVNQGSGPAEWKASILYPDEARPVPEWTAGIRSTPGIPGKDVGATCLQVTGENPREAWDLLFTYDLSTVNGVVDNHTGVVFNGNTFYVSQWNGNSILAYSASGKYLGSHEVSGAENLRTLSWDGYFLYGSPALPLIYKIDPVTFNVVEITTSPVCVRGIAYDPQNDAFWVCDWETDLYLVGREGQTLMVIPNPGIAGVYGIAYDDVTGPSSLWLFCQGDPGATFLQLDIATGQLTGRIHNVLAEVEASGFPVASGAFLSAGISPGVVVLGGILQAEDNLLFGYELTPSSWLSLSSYSGHLDAGASEELRVCFNGEGLALYELYEAIIHFTSDPDVPVTDVQVGYRLVTGTGETPGNLQLSIYPNPAGTELVVECREPVSWIGICDSQGKQVAQFHPDREKRIVVNTNGYPAGLYYIEACLEDGSKTVKKTIIVR